MKRKVTLQTRGKHNFYNNKTKQNAELRSVKVVETVRAPVPISRYCLSGSKATFEDEEKKREKEDIQEIL